SISNVPARYVPGVKTTVPPPAAAAALIAAAIAEVSRWTPSPTAPNALTLKRFCVGKAGVCLAASRVGTKQKTRVWSLKKVIGMGRLDTMLLLDYFGCW